MDHSLSGSSVHGILQASAVGIHIGSFPSFPMNIYNQNSHVSCNFCWHLNFFLHESKGRKEVSGRQNWGGGEGSIVWKVKVAQPCLTLCDPVDYTVHGILQVRILEWVAFPFSRESSQPRDQIQVRTQVSHVAGGFFTSWATGGSWRILEWVAYPFSSRSSWLSVKSRGKSRYSSPHYEQNFARIPDPITAAIVAALGCVLPHLWWQDLFWMTKIERQFWPTPLPL